MSSKWKNKRSSRGKPYRVRYDYDQIIVKYNRNGKPVTKRYPRKATTHKGYRYSVTRSSAKTRLRMRKSRLGI